MATDIILDENILRLEADRVDVHATDLVLDHPARRKDHARPYRRALVHSADDGLTINFGNDYPAGVVINGTVHIPDNVFVGSPPPKAEPKEGLIPVGPDVVGFDPSTITWESLEDLVNHIHETKQPWNLIGQISLLRRAVVALSKRVQELEQRP